jgi:hypothetical protein
MDVVVQARFKRVSLTVADPGVEIHVKSIPNESGLAEVGTRSENPIERTQKAGGGGTYTVIFGQSHQARATSTFPLARFCTLELCDTAKLSIPCKRRNFPDQIPEFCWNFPFFRSQTFFQILLSDFSFLGPSRYEFAFFLIISVSEI